MLNQLDLSPKLSVLMEQLQEDRKSTHMFEESVTRKLDMIDRKLSIFVEYTESKKNAHSDVLPCSADTMDALSTLLATSLVSHKRYFSLFCLLISI